MPRKISLPPNPRDGSRPYRPSVGSAAAAKIPISRATILRNNMMIVGAKNNERNLSLSTGRVPRRSTLQSLRRSLANEDMEAHRSNLPRACGFLLHGESFPRDAGCDYNPRASRIIGYHEETVRSNGSAIPLGAPKTISRPLSGGFRGFPRPVRRSRKPEDCEGCTCIDGECWDEPEPLEHDDHSRPKHGRSTEAGGRVSVVRNVSVQDTNHRLSESVSVQVRAESVDRSSQTDDEENRNPHQLRNVISLSRQSISEQFAMKKRRSRSYPDHFPSDKNMGGRNAKRYGSSESDLEGTSSKVNTSSIKRRKRSFTNPGADQPSENHGLGPSTQEHSAVLNPPTGTDKRPLDIFGEAPDSVSDNRDTIGRSRDYIRRLISEVEQQQKDEMDESEEGGDLNDVEVGRPKRSSDHGRALHHHQKHSDQSGKPRIEHEPVQEKTKRSRPIRFGEQDRIDDIGDRDPSHRARQAKGSKLTDGMSDKSDISSSDRAGATRTQSRGNKYSAPFNERKIQRNRDEEPRGTREYSNPVKNAARQVGKRTVGGLKKNDGDDHNEEIFSEDSLEVSRDERDHVEGLRGKFQGRHSKREANRSVDSMMSQRSDLSVKKASNGRNALDGRRGHRERVERSKEELDQRPSYHSREVPSATLPSEPYDGQKRRKRRTAGDDDSYVAQGRTGKKDSVGGIPAGRPRSELDDVRREEGRRRNDNGNRGSAAEILVEQDRRNTGASPRSRNASDRIPPKRDTTQSGKRLRGTESADSVYSETSVIEPDRKRASVSYGRQVQSNRARLESRDGRQDRVRARNPVEVDQVAAENFDDDLIRRKTRTPRKFRSSLSPKTQRDDKPHKEGAHNRVDHAESTTREAEKRKRSGSLAGLRTSELRSQPKDRQDFRERRTGSIHQKRTDEAKVYRERRNPGGSRDKSSSPSAQPDDNSKNGVRSRRSIARADPSNFVNRKRSDSSLQSRARRPGSEPIGYRDTREHSRQTIVPRYEAEVSGELDRKRTSTTDESRNRPIHHSQRQSRGPTRNRDRNFDEGYTVDHDADDDTVPIRRTGSTRASPGTPSRRLQPNEDSRTASIDRAPTEGTLDESNRNRTNTSRDGLGPDFQRDDITKSGVRDRRSIDRNDPSRVEDRERSGSLAQFRATRPRSVPNDRHDVRDRRTRSIDQSIVEEVSSGLDAGRRTRTSVGSRDRSAHNKNRRRDEASAHNRDNDSNNGYVHVANDDVRNGVVPRGRKELRRGDRPTHSRSPANDHDPNREHQTDNLDRGHPEEIVDDLDRRTTKEPTRRSESSDVSPASGPRSRRKDQRTSNSVNRTYAEEAETEERSPRRSRRDNRGYEQEAVEEQRSRKRTDSPVDPRRILNHRSPGKTHPDKTESEDVENSERKRMTNKKDPGKQKPEVDMTVNRGGGRRSDKETLRTPTDGSAKVDGKEDDRDVPLGQRTEKSSTNAITGAKNTRGERQSESDRIDDFNAEAPSDEKERAQLDQNDIRDRTDRKEKLKDGKIGSRSPTRGHTSDERDYKQNAKEEPHSRRRPDLTTDSKVVPYDRSPTRTYISAGEAESRDVKNSKRTPNENGFGKHTPQDHITVMREAERLLDRSRPDWDEPSRQDRVRSQAEPTIKTSRNVTDGYDETNENKDDVTPRRRTDKSAKLNEKETIGAHRGRGERKLEVDSVDGLDTKQASNEKERAQSIRQRQANSEGPRTSREGRLNDDDDTEDRQHAAENLDRKTVEKQLNGLNVTKWTTTTNTDNDPDHRWRHLPADPHFDEEAALLKIHEFKEKNQHVYAARKSRKRDDDHQREVPDEYVKEQAVAREEPGAEGHEQKHGTTKSTNETPKAELSEFEQGASEEMDRSGDASDARRATQRDGRASEHREEFPQSVLPERRSRNSQLGAEVFDKDDGIEATSENGGRRSRGKKDWRPAEQRRRTLSDSPLLPGDEIPIRPDTADRSERDRRKPHNEQPNSSRLLHSDVDDDEFDEKSQDSRGRDAGKFITHNKPRSAPEDSVDELEGAKGEYSEHRGGKGSRLQVHKSRHPERGTRNEHGYREGSESADRRRGGKSDRPSDADFEDETDELEPARPSTTKQRDNARRSNDVDRRRRWEKERPRSFNENKDGSASNKQRPDRMTASRHAVRQAGGRTDSSEDHINIKETGSMREDSPDRPDNPDKDGRKGGSTMEKRRRDRTRRNEYSPSPSGSPSKKLRSSLAGEKKRTHPTPLSRASHSVDSRGSDTSDIPMDSVRSMSKELRTEAHRPKGSRRRAERSDRGSRASRSKKVSDKAKGVKGEGRALKEAISGNHTSASSHSSMSSTESHASPQSRTGALQKKDKKAKAAIEEGGRNAHSIHHMHENDVKSPTRTERETRKAVERMRKRKSVTGYRHSKSSPRPRDRAERHVNGEVSTTDTNVLPPETSRSLSEVLSGDRSVDSVKSTRKGNQEGRSSKKGRSTKHSKKTKDRKDFEMLKDSSSLTSVTSDQSSDDDPSSTLRSRKSEKDKRASSKAARTSQREARVRPEDFDRSVNSTKGSKKRSSEIWDVNLEKVRDINAIDTLLQSRKSAGVKDGPKTDAELVKEISERMSSIRFKKGEMEPMKKDPFNILESEEKLREKTRTSPKISSVSDKRGHVRVAESLEDMRTRVAHYVTSDETLKREENAENSAEKIPKVSRKVPAEDRSRVSDTHNKHGHSHREVEEKDERDHDHHSAKTRRSNKKQVSQDNSVSKRSTDEPVRQDSDSERATGRDMHHNRASSQHVRDSDKPTFDHRNHKGEGVQEPTTGKSSAAGSSKDNGSSQTRQPPLRGVEQNLSASPLVDCCDSCDVMVLTHEGTSVSGLSELNDKNQLANQESVKQGSQGSRGPSNRLDQAVTVLGGTIAKPTAVDRKTVKKQIIEEESICEMVSGVFSEESCECEESAEVLHDTRPALGSSNRERQEFISKDGKRVIFIPANNNHRETRDQFTDDKNLSMKERSSAINSEMSVIMQRLDTLTYTAPKVTHDQNEQTAQAEIVRPVRHQSEQTVQEPSPRKISRDIGEQTSKQVTREDGEQTLPPRKMSRDQGENTVKPLTREEADQTSRRMSREVGEQTTRRMSKDEAEQTMQVVNIILQQRASPRREEPKSRDLPYESSSEMFEPVTGRMKQKNETKNAETTSPVQGKHLATVESQSQTDHATYQEGDTHSEKQRGKNLSEVEAESEPSSSSSDSTLSDGEYVTNSRMTGFSLSQLDIMRKNRKARRKRGLKNANQEVISSVEDTEEDDESTEDEEAGVVPQRRRSDGQVVTLQYESVTEFLDASTFSPMQHTQTSAFNPAIHHSKLTAVNNAVRPSESQYSVYSNIDDHRPESSGIFNQHHSDENEEEDVELDVSVSQGSENGELPYLHVAREDVVKLPDVLGGHRRES